MADTHALEGLPLWKLTDRQVLLAMRGRGNELETARTLASLCRVFEKAADANPQCAAGLRSAIGLTQMFGIGLAPGHEDHPFKDVDKNMTVQSIMAGTTVPKSDASKPVPILRGPARTFDLDCHMQGQREVTARPTTDMFVDHGQMRTGLQSVQNISRRKDAGVPRKHQEGPSKVAQVCSVIDKDGGQFTAKSIHEQCKNMPDISYQDVQNAILKMRKENRLVAQGWGKYTLKFSEMVA